MVKLPEIEISALLKVFPKGVLAFDVETTGLSPLVDSIIEISAVKIAQDGSIHTFDELINPGIPIPPNTTAIHGISDDMVKDAPNSETVLKNFLNFLEGTTLIAHNAKFDVGFLVYSVHKLGLELPKNEVYCSCQFARKCLLGMPNYKLGTLSTELKITHENQHRALDDAIAALRIYAQGLIKNENIPQGMKNAYLFKVNEFSKNTELSIPKHLEKLKEYCANQTVIEIKYRGGTVKNQFRPVKPISILPLPNGNVLYALCLLSDQHKSFALSKISEIREKDSTT